MKVVKCLNNHFYDADKYSTCPQCGAAMGAGEQATGITSRKAPSGSPATEKSSGSGETFGVFKKKPVFKPVKRETASSSSDNYEKLKKFNTVNQEETNNVNPPAPAMNANSLLGGMASAPVQTYQPPQVTQPAPSIQPAQPKVAEPEEDQNDSLLEEIKKVSSDNEGKTVGFFSSGKQSTNEAPEESNTTASAEPVSAPSNEPIVGWLVCIKGNNIGQSFNIYAGKNTLGRNSSNNIVINKDKSVSREKHTVIIYEPKNRDFYAQPGDSSGLTYVNGEVVLQPTKLDKKALIEVGNTQLLLVPLCGEDFSWEDYL